MRAFIWLVLGVLIPASGLARGVHDPSQVWPGYREAQSAQPLVYHLLGSTDFDGGQRRSFILQSQQWPHATGSASWRHRVELLQPDVPQPGPALLVINNGVIHGADGKPPRAPDDLPMDVLETLVRTLGMAVVSIADVPSQAISLPGDGRLRVEDDLAAASWRRYLDEPATHAHWPLHVPMAEAAIRALDLADQELPADLRPSYIATGASKRAWASWLLPLVDERISHLAPFAIDMHWQALLPHIRQIHAGRWPIALRPYFEHGITGMIGDDAFAGLMEIVDPYTYLAGPLATRLALPKLLVNASGDDFFPPDAARFYLDALPGQTTLRVAPNSDHGGIRRFVLESLAPALHRWRRGGALPQVQAHWQADQGVLQVRGLESERPQRAVMWQAHNARGRDFRHACGIDYVARPLSLGDSQVLEVGLEVPAQGWTATFVELHYADGLVATTPVQVLPQDRFPLQPPAEGAGACRLVPEVSLSGPATEPATEPAAGSRGARKAGEAAWAARSVLARSRSVAAGPPSPGG